MGKNQKPTLRMPPLEPGDKMTVEPADPDEVAAFFDLIARLLREKKKFTVVVE